MKIEKIEGKIIIELGNDNVTLNEQDAVEFMVKCLRASSEIKNAIKEKNEDLQVLKADYCKVQMDILFNDHNVHIKCKYGIETLSIVEFEKQCDAMWDALASMYDTEDFQVKTIDARYLEQILGIDLPFIMNAKIEMIKMEDLRNFSVGNPKGIHLRKGRYYKQISTDSYINYPNHINNFIGQTNEERTKAVLESMKESNYATNGKYIVLYNDSNVIRDGEHRAAALYHLYGNIEIPVLRIKFSHNYYSYKLFYSKGK